MVNNNRIRWHRSTVEGTLCSREFRNYLHVCIPSSWGILVYKEVTSSVTNRVSGGSGGNLLSLLKKTVVSWMNDGGEVAQGCKKQSTKCEMFFCQGTILRYNRSTWTTRLTDFW